MCDTCFIHLKLHVYVNIEIVAADSDKAEKQLQHTESLELSLVSDNTDDNSLMMESDNDCSNASEVSDTELTPETMACVPDQLQVTPSHICVWKPPGPADLAQNKQTHTYKCSN